MSEFEAEVRIDISSSQLLVGRMAVDQHIESGGHPADLFDPSTELGLRSILVQSRDRLSMDVSSRNSQNQNLTKIVRL
jgi:hypothetical protein